MKIRHLLSVPISIYHKNNTAVRVPLWIPSAVLCILDRGTGEVFRGGVAFKVLDRKKVEEKFAASPDVGW